MAELERDLRTLGALVEYPPEPDLVPRVRTRLARPERRWRPLALVVAALVLALAIALAVPPARSAILRFFHLGGVTVERVETLPHATRRSPVAGLGGPYSLADASRVAGFELVPARPMPSRAYADRGLVAMLLRVPGVRGPVLLVELRGEGRAAAKKAATAKTRIEPATVNGLDGLWIEGAPHYLTYFDPLGRIRERTTRLAGNVLLWPHGSLTLRLEGDLSLAQALRIARFVR